MIVKLKKGETLTSNYNYCNIQHDDWVSLNQGKEVNLASLTDEIKDKVVEVTKEVKGG